MNPKLLKIEVKLWTVVELVLDSSTINGYRDTNRRLLGTHIYEDRLRQTDRCFLSWISGKRTQRVSLRVRIPSTSHCSSWGQSSSILWQKGTWTNSRASRCSFLWLAGKIFPAGHVWDTHSSLYTTLSLWASGYYFLLYPCQNGHAQMVNAFSSITFLVSYIFYPGLHMIDIY